jgi:hypothetical protein
MVKNPNTVRANILAVKMMNFIWKEWDSTSKAYLYWKRYFKQRLDNPGRLGYSCFAGVTNRALIIEAKRKWNFENGKKI